jgi:hypothetical protein
MDEPTIASDRPTQLPAYYGKPAAKVTATEWPEYEALAYEIEMQGATARLLASPPDEPIPTRNALLESFALHFRNLVAFFWPASEPLPKDVLVGHLAPGWQPQEPGDLRKLTRRVSREVAHLTTYRLSGPHELKRWQPAQCIAAILPALEALIGQPQAVDRLSPNVAREVHELHRVLDREAGPGLPPVREFLETCYLGTQTARPLGFYR